MSQDNHAFGRRWFEEVWNRGNVSAIREMMAPGCVVHGLGGDLVGPDAFIPFQAAYRNAFPDLHLVVEETVVEGDRLALRWSATATHTGDGLGFPATGRTVRFTGMTIGRVKDGQLVEGWNSFDQLGLLQQLGVVTLPA